jgi:hypothetical protein
LLHARGVRARLLASSSFAHSAATSSAVRLSRAMNCIMASSMHDMTLWLRARDARHGLLD